MKIETRREEGKKEREREREKICRSEVKRDEGGGVPRRRDEMEVEGRKARNIEEGKISLGREKKFVKKLRREKKRDS